MYRKGIWGKLVNEIKKTTRMNKYIFPTIYDEVCCSSSSSSSSSIVVVVVTAAAVKRKIRCLVV